LINTKKILFVCLLLAISASISAQIDIPTGVSNVVVPCGTNNYAATMATGTGGTGVEWFSDYLCTNSLGTNGTYNGVTATSTMIYAKSTNGAASSNDPKQVYIFKPQLPTASFTTANSCSGVNLTVTVDSILDSLTTIVLEDATIDPNAPGTNYNNNFLVVRPQGFCGGNVHFLSKYDLGVIPPNVSPIYSKSSVVAYHGYAHGGNGNVYEQHVINDAWDETTVTNATAPLPAVPNSTANSNGSWWVWYGANGIGDAHVSSATMGVSTEGDKPRSNTNVLLNQLVNTEYLGDQTMSLYHFSPGYDSRYYSKDFKTNTSLLPQLKTIFSYNQAATCTYSWTGPSGFTATTKDISNLTQSGLYTLTITSIFGCVGIMNANIIVPPGTLDIDPIADIVVCDSLQLPAITGTSLVAPAYYTGIGGTGTVYNAGDWIYTSGTYYIYDQTGTIPNCTDEETFTITINQCGCTSTILDEPFNTAVIVGAIPATIYGNGGSDHNAAYALSGTFFGWFNIQNGIGPVDIFDRTVNGLSIGCTVDATIWMRETWGGANVDISLIDGFGAVMTTTNLTLNGTYQQITLSAVATTTNMRYLIHFNGVGGNGLDIITEDLLITQTCNTVTGIDTQVACTSYNWIDGNNYVTSNNTATHTIVGGSAGGCDSIVTLDLTINNTVNSTDTQVACNTYLWIDGNNYVASNNTATHTIAGGATNGCDSIITLDLTINNTVNSTDTQVACNTYLWIDGNNYVASNNTATHTIVGGAANGCDSIVTLDLTINNTVNSTDTQTACVSYTWIDGNNYIASNNTATHNIVGGAANGCDSIITLDLTINNTVNSTDTQTACVSYNWIDGNNYIASNNTATHTIVGGAAQGCDSIVTLDLTINNPVNSTDIQVACVSYNWIDGNNYVANNNTATHNIVGGAANGCDSIITLNLTINNPVNSTDVQVACVSYNWIDGNNYVANNNTATHTIVGGAANGCDSIVSLDLTINNLVNSIDVQVACDTYLWINGINYITSNDTATHTIVGGAANGCDSIVTLNLTINTTPTVTVPNDLTYCNGDITIINTFTSTTFGTTFTWTNSNPAIGLPAAGSGNIPSFTAINSTGASITSSISVTPSANGCVGLPVIYNITISPAISIPNIVTDITCFGDNDGKIELTPLGGTPGYSYSWTAAGTGNSPVANNLPSGQVTVTVTDATNCSQDSTFTITEPAEINYVLFNADKIEGCAPLDLAFFNSTDTSLISYLSWDLGNGDVYSGAVDIYDTISSVIYSTPGSYDVSLSITDKAGCPGYLTLPNYITVHDNPVADFTYNPTHATLFDPTIYFTDISQYNITDWAWSFAGLGTSTNQHPNFIFPGDTGSYQVSLSVIDNNTCFNSITKTIKIFGEFGIYVPNSFSPDSDGLNDEFSPIGFGISMENYSFFIFDRWGELIFETNDISKGWDGTFKGKPLPDGIYVWKLFFKDLDNTVHQKTGHVNIIK